MSEAKVKDLRIISFLKQLKLLIFTHKFAGVAVLHITVEVLRDLAAVYVHVPPRCRLKYPLTSFR